MNSSRTLEISRQLLRRPSLTPDDGGCQEYLEALLSPLGFARTRVDCGGVTNSIYERPGEKPGLLGFAGHTDVVPTGPLERWPHPPFEAVVADGILHGRGAQDMKTAIACFVAALEAAISTQQPLPSIQMLITSDEEGESVNGTIRLVEYLAQHQRLPDGVIVGEPSSTQKVGDMIRRGRRGVLQAHLNFLGKQGHSAYPALTDNAIHHAIAALNPLLSADFSPCASGFPPTSCQITNMQAGTGAVNVVPGQCKVTVDIRYNPGITVERLKEIVLAGTEGHRLECQFMHQAEAFTTEDGSFLDYVCNGMARVTGYQPQRDTGGGTSDGRFLAAVGVPVAEVGVGNDTIHQIGEQVAVADLKLLTAIYHELILSFPPTFPPTA